MSKPILFISDLHLQDDRPDLTRALLMFLQENQGKCEELYILGDLFEVWLGDDRLTATSEAVAKALHEFAECGSDVYIMHGNRDFLMGTEFAARCGASLLAEPYRLHSKLGDIVLMHGDVLCTDDTEYQTFRSMVRSAEWQADFLARNLDERIAFARQARQQSSVATAQKQDDIMDVNQAAVLEFLKRVDCPRLLHGHTHRPDVHSIALQSKIGGSSEAIRMVLGDWGIRGWFAELDGEHWQLKQFSIST
ncbi:MAG: UDP-2,3-diacylglucosamine diphosphatase [Gammaproteobacteria bacterium]|nr:UDP-2,3-diacylglucosamine diphosphatase [Gammaproteobacteria bacterium]